MFKTIMEAFGRNTPPPPPVSQPTVDEMDKVAAYWMDRAERAEDQVSELQRKLEKHTRGLALGSAASAAKRAAVRENA